MNVQVHDVTGSSPYELVFGQKPQAHYYYFNWPAEKSSGPLLEKELEADEIEFEEIEKRETKGETQLIPGELK